MYVGNLILRLGGVFFNSPQFGRGGLAATFSCEVFALTASSTFEIDVQHKNPEDTAFTTVGSFDSITTTGVKYKDLSGLKEQVRLRCYMTGSAATDACYFNVLAPQWRPY